MDSETNPEDTDYVDVIIFPSAKAKVLRFPIVSKVIWIVNNGRKEEDLASELRFMSAVCGFCWLVPLAFWFSPTNSQSDSADGGKLDLSCFMVNFLKISDGKQE